MAKVLLIDGPEGLDAFLDYLDEVDPIDEPDDFECESLRVVYDRDGNAEPADDYDGPERPCPYCGAEPVDQCAGECAGAVDRKRQRAEF